MPKHYDKLIRDRIPYLIQGKKFSMRTASEDEIVHYVAAKIEEELKEFFENPCIEEAADLAEIIDKLFLSTIGFKMNDNEFRKARAAKKNERGAFNENLILIEVDDENIGQED